MGFAQEHSFILMPKDSIFIDEFHVFGSGSIPKLYYFEEYELISCSSFELHDYFAYLWFELIIHAINCTFLYWCDIFKGFQDWCHELRFIMRLWSFKNILALSTRMHYWYFLKCFKKCIDNSMLLKN